MERLRVIYKTFLRTVLAFLSAVEGSNTDKALKQVAFSASQPAGMLTPSFLQRSWTDHVPSLPDDSV